MHDHFLSKTIQDQRTNTLRADYLYVNKKETCNVNILDMINRKKQSKIKLMMTFHPVYKIFEIIVSQFRDWRKQSHLIWIDSLKVVYLKPQKSSDQLNILTKTSFMYANEKRFVLEHDKGVKISVWNRIFVSQMVWMKAENQILTECDRNILKEQV